MAWEHKHKHAVMASYVQNLYTTGRLQPVSQRAVQMIKRLAAQMPACVCEPLFFPQQTRPPVKLTHKNRMFVSSRFLSNFSSNADSSVQMPA